MINRFKWLEVKPETRKNMVVFLNSTEGFAKVLPTGNVEVAGNKVVCDGFTDQDLCNITPELLRAALDEKSLEYLNINKNDIYAMFYELVRRLEIPPVELPKEFFSEPNSILDKSEERIGIVPDSVVAGDIKKSFCEFCDSRGHFHKKDCPSINK